MLKITFTCWGVIYLVCDYSSIFWHYTVFLWCSLHTCIFKDFNSIVVQWTYTYHVAIKKKYLIVCLWKFMRTCDFLLLKNIPEPQITEMGFLKIGKSMFLVFCSIFEHLTNTTEMCSCNAIIGRKMTWKSPGVLISCKMSP